SDYYLASIANEYMNVKEVGQYINSNLASSPENTIHIQAFKNINFLDSDDWTFGFYKFKDFDRKKGGFSSKWKDKTFDANEWNHLAVFLSQSYQQNYIADKFKASVSFSLLTQDKGMIAENIIESDELVIPYSGDINFLDKKRFDFYFYFTEDIIASNCKLRMNIISEDHSILESQDIGIVVGEYTSNLLLLENAYFEGKPESDIHLTFSDALNMASINETSLKLLNTSNVNLEYSTTYSIETNTLVINPSNDLTGDFSLTLSPGLEGITVGYFDSDNDGAPGPDLELDFDISYINPKFEASKTENYVNETIRFYNQSELVNTSASNILWDFGDGNTSTSENPYHTFDVAGSYPVSLTIQAANGNSYTLAKENYITINSFNEGHDLGLWLLELDNEWLTPDQNLGFEFFVRNFGDYTESDYEILYTLRNQNGQVVAQDVETGESVPATTSTSKYDLSLSLDPLPEGFYSFVVQIRGNQDCALANNTETRNIYIGDGNPFETYEYINNGQLYYKDVKRNLEGSGYSISVDDHDSNHAWVKVYKDDGTFYERRYVAVGELEFFNAYQLCLVYKSEFSSTETAWCFGIPGNQITFSPSKLIVEADQIGTYNVLSNEEDDRPTIDCYLDGGEETAIVSTWYKRVYTNALPFSNVYFDVKPPLSAERKEYTFWVKITADGEFLQKLNIEVIDPQPNFSVSINENTINTGPGLSSSIFIELDT
ncbi:MAG: PKD domain-containing protein, partial [Bacteroidales bacterium]|nr:PKD domain-containing protein [Bacteroidales bacterium]